MAQRNNPQGISGARTGTSTQFPILPQGISSARITSQRISLTDDCTLLPVNCYTIAQQI